MENVMDLMSSFQGDTLSRLSSQFHETPSAIHRGLLGALPASVAALASHVTSKQSAEDLLNVFRKGDYPHVDAGEVARVAADPEATSRLTQSSSGFLSRIFGNRLSGTVDAIASDSGIGRGSATSLLSLAAPLMLGFFGRQAKSNNLDAGGLLKMLTDQGRKATSALPGPVSKVLGGAGALGEASGTIDRAHAAASRTAHDARAGVGDAARHARASTAEAHAPQARRGFWWALLAAAILLALAWRMFSHRGMRNETRPAQETSEMQREAAPAAPHGTEPNAPPYQGAQPGTDQHAQGEAVEPGSPETDQRAATVPNPTQNPQGTANEPSAPGADQRAAHPTITQRNPNQPGTAEGNEGAANEPSAMAPGGTPEEAKNAEANQAAASAEEGPATGTGEGAEATGAHTMLSAQSGAAPFTAALSGSSALPQSFMLQDVTFPTGSAALPKNPMLGEVADALKQHDSARIRLEGFADARGSQQVNERLSEQRAEAVKHYLVARGVPADHIETAGRAAEQPRANNASQQGRADNRRVEMTLLDR